MPKRTKTADDSAGPILSPARTRVIYCGDPGAPGEQLKKLPGGSVDLITMDPPFHSNRNDEVFWGETKEQRAFQDRHESTQATIEFMRPRSVELARVLKNTGSFYYHCDCTPATTSRSCSTHALRVAEAGCGRGTLDVMSQGAVHGAKRTDDRARDP